MKFLEHAIAPESLLRAHPLPLPSFSPPLPPPPPLPPLARPARVLLRSLSLIPKCSFFVFSLSTYSSTASHMLRRHSDISTTANPNCHFFFFD